jgi:hypothetical protein
LLALVPISPTQAYAIDLFWASSGRQVQTWTQHAATDNLRAERLRNLAPVDTMEAPLRCGRRARISGDIELVWTWPDGAGLRTWMLPARDTTVTLAHCPPEEDLLAAAFNDAGAPIAGSALPFRGIALVQRRETVSCFAAVHEPYRTRPLISSVRQVDATSGQGLILDVSFEAAGRSAAALRRRRTRCP